MPIRTMSPIFYTFPDFMPFSDGPHKNIKSVFNCNKFEAFLDGLCSILANNKVCVICERKVFHCVQTSGCSLPEWPDEQQ
jgi:hypothetical protein